MSRAGCSSSTTTMCCAWVMLGPIFRSRHRQGHLEGGALARTGAFDLDPTAVQIDDALDDRKTEPGRGFARSRLGRKPLEAPEQPGNVFRREAGPLIPDFDDYTAAVAADQEADGAADRTVFDRVAHEVVDRLADAVGVAGGDVIGWGGDGDRLLLARGER